MRNFLNEDGKLTAFPAKRKMKLYCLLYLAQKIEPGKVYTGWEINNVLLDWHAFTDPAPHRRGVGAIMYLLRSSTQ